MQVFMPYSDLKQSACCLDTQRLGNQVYREAKTLISGGWPNHPAAKIWRDYRGALAHYCLYGLQELERRGRSYPKWIEFFHNIYWEEMNRLHCELPIDLPLPPIIGHEPFHSGHRAALLAKGIMDETYRLAKQATQAPVALRTTPKSFWTMDDYVLIWSLLGYRPPGFYAQYNWTEKPIFNTKDAYVWSLQ